MADVTIDADIHNFTHYVTNSRGGVYWTSPTVGYAIYLDADTDLVYSKTVDGGETWGADIEIQPGIVEKYDCWADWQTSGDAGTKIHIGYTDNASDDVRYCYLDTDGDSVGGDVEVEACQGTGSLQVAITRVSKALSIAKTRGGNLAIAVRYVDTGSAGFYSFYTSPDGAVWTSRADPWEAVESDYLILFPANLADADDLWGVYWDLSTDEISLKTFDDSGNSWSEQLISGNMTDHSVHLNFSGEIRLSDGHLILAAWNFFDNVAADLMIWDITDAGTITAKTNVLTNSAESGHCSVFIDQKTDDIYVAYARGGTANSLMTVYYDKSDDGAGSWDGESAMQADVADDEKWVSCGAVKEVWGGKFQPIWFNDDDNDLFTNSDNGISIAAAGAEGLSIPVAMAHHRKLREN